MTVAIATMPRSAKRCVKFDKPYQPRRVASSTVARLVPSSVWTSVSESPATTSQCHSGNQHAPTDHEVGQCRTGRPAPDQARERDREDKHERDRQRTGGRARTET